MLASPARPVYAALYEGHLAGFAILEVGLRGIATLKVLYVEPHFRRVGLGEALLEAAVDAATSAGCSQLDVPVLPGAGPAKSLFETAGLRARLLVMSRTLPR